VIPQLFPVQGASEAHQILSKAKNLCPTSEESPEEYYLFDPPR